jgi:integrase
MAILAECPVCHTKQAKKNKKCIGWLDKKSGLKCNENLDDAKKAKKVKYWISYRMPDGKQRRESVAAMEDLDPYSITDARTAESKRMVQKKENRILEMLPESKISFDEMAKWYLALKTVKKLSSYPRIEIALNNFNKVYGHREAISIKLIDIEDYQEEREEQGMSAATIDMEISIVKTMITKAFYSDKIDGRILKAFNNVKKKLKKGSNARKRTLSFIEYLKMIGEAPKHLRNILIVAFNTGMRKAEIRKIRWSHIDHDAMFIRLPAEVTGPKIFLSIIV